MEEQRENYKQQSLMLCDRLLSELGRNKNEASNFLGGDIYRAYIDTTDAAISKVRRTRNKLRNL